MFFSNKNDQKPASSTHFHNILLGKNFQTIFITLIEDYVLHTRKHFIDTKNKNILYYGYRNYTIRGGSRIPHRRGRQHMILPNFAKDCMK